MASISVSTFPFSFFFNDTATTEIYTLSLHDALPICADPDQPWCDQDANLGDCRFGQRRSEEHTSELQSRSDLVCRLVLAHKKNTLQGQVSKNIHKPTEKPKRNTHDS